MKHGRPYPRTLMAAAALQAVALAAVIVLMAAASDRVAGAYAWTQVVPVGLFAAMTVGIGFWAARTTTKAAWITGLVTHLIALPLYGGWVFFWTFVFGMERGTGDFVDNSVAFSVVYAVALVAIVALFVGGKPDRPASAESH